MLFLQAIVVILLLAVCTFAPGFFFIRRLRWTAMEQLCSAVALSLMLLWLSAWALYLMGAPAWAGYAITAACIGAAAASFGDLRRLLRIARVRRVLVGFVFLLGWTLLALCIIRVYNGASWKSDWLEHFQRTLFFAQHFPKETPIFGDYLLPARPPAQNVLAAFFLTQTADRFELFQIVFAYLNLLVFLPCCLALPMLARSRRWAVLPLVALFAASPVAMQNATYVWTKMLTAFFVILATLLYVRGWRRDDAGRIRFAFLCLAMGLLTHYSAGPYIVVLGLHYLVVVLPKRSEKWKELALIAISSGALIATWIGWSLAVYGTKATFASNSSVTLSQSQKGSNLEKIVGNMWDSLVPHVLRDSSLVRFFDQPNALASLRDNIFLTYQVQLIFTMGLIGGPLVLWLLWRGFRRPRTPAATRRFWVLMIGASVVIGLSVVGERDYYGTAHLTLLPLELLGLTLLASRFRQGRILAMLLIAGCVIDFSLGVFLHLRVQHLENTAEHTYFSGPSVINGQVVVAPSPEGLSGYASDNWLRKHQLANAQRWRGELLNVQAEGKPQVMAMLDQLTTDDPRLFKGWYARHGGEVEYLGDHFGTSDIPSIVLGIVFAGLMWKLWTNLPAVRKQAVAPAPVKRKKR
ncbi:MAG TPA: hypothetical protein VNV86_02685 [Candidatus Acidoferrum sp.]|nr:hypothetical protein [Candidatus Acidoferrum sp.]